MTRAQGWYYLLGGIWPLVHFRSFQLVAGPKPDRFQTEVTSGLFVAIGAALLSSPRDPPPPRTALVLSAASGLATAYVDLRHRRDIRGLFDVEAAVEAGFALVALRSLLRARRGHGTH
ncbi:MAG TPA: hypothetical protein VLC50_07650 [Actinomycetes bacterium]|nr:hypothetical protein [Actinomycetes bacterium]